MADALVSTPVASGAGIAAIVLLGVAGYKVNKAKGVNSSIVPLMGVLGAFVFAAQMINFTIPGTGSSGHIIGGVLLAAFLGLYAPFQSIRIGRGKYGEYTSCQQGSDSEADYHFFHIPPMLFPCLY